MNIEISQIEKNVVDTDKRKAGYKTISSKKKSKNIQTPEENKDEESFSRIKPFINMYDPFG
ncbi:MAG TPA: hypothetical protein VGK59_00360 [Ohtaekwangia sp.]